MKDNLTNKLKTFLFGFGIIILYQILLSGLYFSIFYKFAKSDNFWISNLTYVFYYILITLILIFLFRKSLKKEWLEFKKNWKQFIKIGFSFWLKGFLLMIISNLIIVSISGNIAGNEETNRLVMTQMPLYAILVMGFFGPFIEEIAFRKSFRPGFKNKYAFATFSALIFGGLHVISGFDSLTLTNILNNWQQLLYIVPYGSLGFFFALAYYETDNIFTSFSIHSFHNLGTVLLLFLMNFLVR